MESLYKFLNKIEQNADRIDGHIHLFDHTGILFDKISLDCDKFIGFMDVDLKNLDKYDKDSVIKYYDNFIKKYYNSNITLLATGKDCDTMISLYNKYPNIIKGFGEIKCYKEYTGLNSSNTIKLPYGNLNWFEKLCEFDNDLGLPLFLHWYINSEKRKNDLKKLLKKYPNIPFVLCHCGMSYKYDYKFQYKYLLELLNDCNNLYVDVSYKPILFFTHEDKKYLQSLTGRCLIGTDINPKGCNDMDKIQNYINSFNNINQYALDCKNTFNKLFKR